VDNQIMEATGAGIKRGVVVHADPSGHLTVRLEDGEESCRCSILQTGPGRSLRIVASDEVLIWQGSAAADGVILGRIASSRELLPEALEDVPDELVLEAKHTLTLRVGDGSITIREDGKILIKGKDLVSHAARTNRIKGGSVKIN